MRTTAPAIEPIQDAGYVDVLIVGAGVSGVGAAHHLREQFPERTFVILDAQDNRGGTWWTHQYPGVRSDSDLFTYGYRFKPWRGPSIAAGQEILAYLDEVIDEDGLGQWIRYRHRVTAASWSTEERRWTVEVPRATTDSRCDSRPASCGCARATTTTPSPSSRNGKAWIASGAWSCTPSGGPRISTWRASALW